MSQIMCATICIVDVTPLGLRLYEIRDDLRVPSARYWVPLYCKFARRQCVVGRPQQRSAKRFT